MIGACRGAKSISDQAYARVRELNREANVKIGSGPQRSSKRCAYVAGVLGVDQDEYTGGPACDLWDSYEEFAETVPTTLAGLFATLTYAGEIAEYERDAFNDVDIFSTFAAAAEAPLARSV
jgi:hypothetical protein